ncbi:MAG: hypothetical protein LIO93_03150 [Bacteroidales bacterium]|nr:hypothetical protein [Bacteroidales bacterium]
MNRLMDAVSRISRVPVPKIRSRRRSGREVSYAKMIFCYLAYHKLNYLHKEIALFLTCSASSVYYLINSYEDRYSADGQFREIAGLVLEIMENSG